jgi:hypothetical protein
MVAGIVRAGVPWPQHPGQDLSTAGHEQRVEAEPALVVSGGQLLLGMDADRGRVEIEDHTRGGRSCLPRPPTGERVCPTNTLDLALADREQHPSRGGNGCDLAEQRRLPRERREIRDAPSAIAGHHCQIAEHPARIMGGATLTSSRERTAQRVGQAQPLCRQRQHSAPRARGQTRPVRRHIYRSERRISDHLQGEPPERVDCRLRHRNPLRPGGRSALPPQQAPNRY